MIDIAAHVNEVVSKRVKAAFMLRGVHESEIGWAVGGFGQMAPLVGDAGVALSPSWSVLVTVRSRIIGYPPVGGSAPVPGIIPKDSDFESVIDQLVASVYEGREKEFRGEQ